MTLAASILRDVFTPAEEVTAAEWLRRNFYTHDGRAFSEQAVPWVTAPQGPCWAYDNIQFRTIWLQWAARMFKTNFGLGMLMRGMDVKPSETMFATPDETNCKSVFTRLWRMIENCPPIRDEAPIEQRQSKTAIQLRRSMCHGAWPRGKSRLADKSIPRGHGNEIDKWEYQTTSTEGDPLPRFLKRGAEYPDRKFVLESTPGTKGMSRIEAGRLASTNHRYHVPCPHCATFQTIEFGDGTKAGGLFWEKRQDGSTDRQLARKTAHYVCKHCEGKITDLHRPGMVNCGVWVPSGCEVNHDEAMRARDLPPDDMSWLRGEPFMWGSEYGSQISVFYALFHGWGDIVYDFLSKKKTPGDLRQWTNEDKAETWEIVARKQTWEQLGDRLIVDVPHGVVPDGHKWVTIGIDKQEGFYVYSVDSWRPSQGSHTLAYGYAETTDELYDLIRRKWPTQSGGQMKCSAALIDSGFRPAEVHKFVKRCTAEKLPVRACRGSSTQLDAFYTQKVTGKRSSNPGNLVVWVDTHATQDWLEQRLHALTPDAEAGASLFLAPVSEHQDWLQQMLNDGLNQTLDPSNNVRETWQRIDAMIPNDFRDCKRYAFVGFLLVGRGNRPTRTSQGSKQKQAPSHLIRRDGGWLKGMR